MKKYTIGQLEAMKLDEIKGIAKNEFKLALSEKGKRFTKGQLIVKIAAMVTSHEIKEEEKKEVKVPIKFGLDTKNTHTIVAQAKKFLDNAVNSYGYINDKKRLNASISHVEETIQLLRKQIVKGKAKGMKRKQVNSAISLMSIMVNSYRKKVGVQN